MIFTLSISGGDIGNPEATSLELDIPPGVLVRS